MRYFVIGADGQKYGPADIATLNQWAQENRLNAAQLLEEEASGTRVAASSVTGINFPVAQSPTFQQGPANYSGGQPYQPHYARPTYSGDDGSKDLTTAWVLGALTFLCGCFLLPVFGLMAANRAIEKGNPGGNAAKIFNIVLLVLNLLGVIFYIVMFTVGGAASAFN